MKYKKSLLDRIDGLFPNPWVLRKIFCFVSHRCDICALYIVLENISAKIAIDSVSHMRWYYFCNDHTKNETEEFLHKHKLIL